MCLTSPGLRAYVTVGQYVPPTIPANAATNVQIPLAGGAQINGRDAFPRQNAELTDGCFSTGEAMVAKVDRFRYHVVSFFEDGTRLDPATGGNVQTVGSRPYLMLDQGLIDEYQIMVDPVALGGGVPVFRNITRPLNLRLTGTQAFSSGVVLLSYEPADSPRAPSP